MAPKVTIYDVVINVLTSRTAVSGVVENFVNVIYPLKMVKILLFLEKSRLLAVS